MAEGAVQSTTCKVCGRQPAERFVIKRHVGMILAQRFFKMDAVLCREHAIAYSKEYLGKTLIQGWWGIISFFVNWGNVAADLSALSRAKKMGEPVGAAAAGATGSSIAGGEPPPPAPLEPD